MKPKFKKPVENDTFQILSNRVYQLKNVLYCKVTNRSILLNGILLFLIYLSFILLLWSWPEHLFSYLLITVILGILCVPMILVIGHESIHGNFTNKRTINLIGKNIFYFLGTSPYFWELRHLHAHHNFTNIKRWDLDIEQSELIRLDDCQQYRPFHRYQMYYMPFLFMLYTLNWFFHRDFKDISLYNFGSKELKSHPVRKILYLFSGKLWHLSFLCFIPLLTGYDWQWVLTGFLAFHFSASLATTLILISTHVGEEHELLNTENKDMPYSWAEHQIRTSGNFSTNSSILLHFFGGFNHHLTHHLFPGVPYVLYPQITPLVKEYCESNNLPYHHYSSLFQCIKSHFLRLKKYSTKNQQL